MFAIVQLVSNSKRTGRCLHSEPEQNIEMRYWKWLSHTPVFFFRRKFFLLRRRIPNVMGERQFNKPCEAFVLQYKKWHKLVVVVNERRWIQTIVYHFVSYSSSWNSESNNFFSSWTFLIKLTLWFVRKVVRCCPWKSFFSAYMEANFSSRFQETINQSFEFVHFDFALI